MGRELSLLEAAGAFASAEFAIRRNGKRALERVAAKVERTAKSEFGVYQPPVGEFPGWPELADSTQEEREHLGFTPNDPLLRTGELRDSIEHEVDELEAVVGSTSEIMPYQELGTSKIPPRPVLGPALVRNRHEVVKQLGGAVVAGIIGADVYGDGPATEIHESLGYGSTISE